MAELRRFEHPYTPFEGECLSKLDYSSNGKPGRICTPVSRLRTSNDCLLHYRLMVRPEGFEPSSRGSKPQMLGRYTTVLMVGLEGLEPSVSRISVGCLIRLATDPFGASCWSRTNISPNISRVPYHWTNDAWVGWPESNRLQQVHNLLRCRYATVHIIIGGAERN